VFCYFLVFKLFRKQRSLIDMLRGNKACELTGIPLKHAEAFQEVANEKSCMIASRAVGKYATGLILENYSSKGFHNKAKSCNWGPMAGFVLTDPRFTKAGETQKGRDGQAKSLIKAVDSGAIAVPLYISEDRRKWLEKEGIVRATGISRDRVLCRAVSPWGLALNFALVKERPFGANADMWGVCYESTIDATGLQYVMALRDPFCTIEASNYRAATTGDYDLFALYPQAKSYHPDTQDRRMVNHNTLESRINSGAKDTGEDEHLGNVTPRILVIRDALNIAINRRGYTGGNMVHHSDEGGRPFVNDVDLPVFAVVPGQNEPYGIESVEDLRQFIGQILGANYAPMFNPGWMKELTHVGRGGISPLSLIVKKSQLKPKKTPIFKK
jgi:hypothetical protein